MSFSRALILFVFLASAALGQERGLDHFLPDCASYAKEVPRPAEILGFEVGSWHPRPDQIEAYGRALAEASPRVLFQVYGRSHERRAQVLLTISSPENLERLDEIREGRRQLFDPELERPELAAMPLVAFMGYSVHGNESSGASAAILLAYRLAAAQDEATKKLLAETVVLIDPCLNPDGVARFAHWVNTNRGRRVNDDPRHREHKEPWPGGRTNHYWFDLNRDWLLARQPESRARLRIIEAWRPNLLTDFHEMGTNSTYFFQPGVRSRMNPLIPDRNFELTAKIAEANAAALDRIGSLYYSQETFDDFYFGKGSTYPDGLGGVGILFEQASARGHAQKNRYGRIDFPFTIRNQLVCSQASLEAAHARRLELLGYQREFYETALELAAADEVRAVLFHAPEAPHRAAALVDLLRMHGIRVHRPSRDLTAATGDFRRRDSFLVPFAQPQYRLLKSLFERRVEFRDPVFYDVSTWNVLASFDLPQVELGDGPAFQGLVGEEVRELAQGSGRLVEVAGDGPCYAYLIPWDADRAALALIELQDAGLRVLAASESLQLPVGEESRQFPPGSLVIPLGIQEMEPAALARLMTSLAEGEGLEIVEVASGLTGEGVDLGSPTLEVLARPRVLLLVGEGSSAYEAGHVWHQLDQVLGMQVTLLDLDDLSAEALRDYSHLIAVSGTERRLGRMKDDLESWLRAGGTLIAQRSAAFWAGRELMGLPSQPIAADDRPTPAENYGERARYRAESRISGAIFAAELDRSHPLCWGLVRDRIALWHSGSEALPSPRNPLDAVIRYRGPDEVLISGYAAPRLQKRLAGSCAAAVERLGRGVVVRLACNLNFRAIWPGTSRIFTNALFMAPLTESTQAEDEDADAHEDESH